MSITKRASELRSTYATEMGLTTREHGRGKVVESRAHYAKALAARAELNALGFDLFGAL